MDPSQVTISVYGLGYIGLPTCLEFACAGYRVIGVDTNPAVVDSLSKGEVHIFEEGLADWFARIRSQGNLSATTEPVRSDVFFIAVPTPIHPDKTANLDAVRSASKAIATVIRPGALVVLISTCPPRTCLDVVAPIIAEHAGLDHTADYDLVHCPERVLPGAILKEFKNNARIIGGTTERATERAYRLYATIVDPAKLHRTDSVTAETCKVMENTFRDVNIALANEVATVCRRLDIDPSKAIELANLHPRVNYLTPGIGVGGHCIPVDPWFLIESARDITPVLQAARLVNDARPHEVVEQILDAAAVGPIGVFGLAFKPDVDDFRESPAVRIVELLAQHEDEPILVCDPYARALPEALREYENVRLVDADEAIAAPTVVGLVAHREFASLSIPDQRRVLDFVKAFR